MTGKLHLVTNLNAGSSAFFKVHFAKTVVEVVSYFSVRGCVIVSGLLVDQECQAEMRTFAIELFENYKISPIVVQKCEVEIKSHCQHVIGKHDDGDMMDCLMTLAATNDSLSPGCYNAV